MLPAMTKTKTKTTQRERELTREDQVIYREQKVTTTKGNNPNYAH